MYYAFVVSCFCLRSKFDCFTSWILFCHQVEFDFYLFQFFSFANTVKETIYFVLLSIQPYLYSSLKLLKCFRPCTAAQAFAHTICLVTVVLQKKLSKYVQAIFCARGWWCSWIYFHRKIEMCVYGDCCQWVLYDIPCYLCFLILSCVFSFLDNVRSFIYLDFFL